MFLGGLLVATFVKSLIISHYSPEKDSPIVIYSHKIILKSLR